MRDLFLDFRGTKKGQSVLLTLAVSQVTLILGNIILNLPKVEYFFNLLNPVTSMDPERINPVDWWGKGGALEALHFSPLNSAHPTAPISPTPGC